MAAVTIFSEKDLTSESSPIPRSTIQEELYLEELFPERDDLEQFVVQL